jgi:hypothetical protein
VQGVHPECQLKVLSLSHVRDATPLHLAALLSAAGGGIRRLDLSGLNVSDPCVLFHIVRERCRGLEHFDLPLPHLINDAREAGSSFDAVHDMDGAQAEDGEHEVPVAERDFSNALGELRRACPLAHVSDDRARIRHESGEMVSPSKKGVARTMFAAFLGTEGTGPHV